VQTFLIALLAASIVGIVLGAAVGRAPALDRLLGPFLEYCRVMPPAAIIPIAVLTLGYTERMKTIVVVFAAMWPILLQVRAGARSLDAVLVDTGRSLHLGRIGTVRKIVAPSLVPSALVGIRLATPTVLIIVILVEIITRVDGLGGLIAQSQQAFNSAAVFGLLALTALLALTVNNAVAMLEERLVRYSGRQ
jgi:ABC-type nitrate/sulfonate/bicarbonate transport system permease component